MDTKLTEEIRDHIRRLLTLYTIGEMKRTDDIADRLVRLMYVETVRFAAVVLPGEGMPQFDTDSMRHDVFFLESLDTELTPPMPRLWEEEDESLSHPGIYL